MTRHLCAPRPQAEWRQELCLQFLSFKEIRSNRSLHALIKAAAMVACKDSRQRNRVRKAAGRLAVRPRLHGWARVYRRRPLPQGRELLRLMPGHERRGQVLQIAVHDLFDLEERKVDAVVGDAALREVVGADALGAVDTALDSSSADISHANRDRCCACSPTISLSGAPLAYA
jgi:hypothetical protein